MTRPSARPEKVSAARPYSHRRLGAVTALLILFLSVALASVQYVSYMDSLRQAQTNLRNLSIAFSAQTFSVAQAIDNLMLQAERGFSQNSGPDGRAHPFAHFGDNSLARQYLLGIHLFDAKGQLIGSDMPAMPSATALPSAGEIRAAIDVRPGKLRISISDVDSHTGRGVINFSRSTFDSTGRSTGAVIAQADSERFERIFSLVDLGKGGSVTLFNRNGTMLVRGPNYPSGIGRSFADTPLFRKYLPRSERGTFIADSPLDGVERLYGYDAVNNYPLVIITGMDTSDALLAWYERTTAALIFLGLFSVTVLLMARRFARDAMRQASLIGKLKSSEARAEKSAEYLETIINSLGTPVWVLDSARKIIMLNDAFSRFVGRTAAELLGRDEQHALDPGNAAERDRRYRKVLAGAQSTEAISEIQDGAGSARTVIQLTSKLLDETGQAQIVNVLTDITEREKTERRLAYVANHDVLTGLPNQMQFQRLLEAEVVSAAARHTCVGVLAVSVARVREITDLLGHEAGDNALAQIGAVFHSLAPEAKCVARIKSSEFAVLIEAPEGRDFLEQYAIELHRRLSAALRVHGREFYLGPAIGVAIFPEDGASADELFQRADSALSRAGGDVSDTIHFYSARAQTDLDERLTVEAQLRRAVERNELRLEFQPKVRIDTGRIVGFEALLRWNNPELGEVSPVRFIPIAERTGLIVQIGAWALQEACRLIHAWNQAGTRVKVAVNLSPRQFYQKDLLPMIRQCIERSAVPLGSLELEITESTLMSREQEVDVLMREIRRLGVELSIDDFGTGYSSLAYLKRFPVQRLKVDRAFIHDLGKDEDSAAIVRSIVNLAHGLKLCVVAEGVETEQQLAILRSMESDEFQGYLFSRPVEAGAVLALLEKNRTALV